MSSARARGGGCQPPTKLGVESPLRRVRIALSPGSTWAPLCADVAKANRLGRAGLPVSGYPAPAGSVVSGEANLAGSLDGTTDAAARRMDATARHRIFI